MGRRKAQEKRRGSNRLRETERRKKIQKWRGREEERREEEGDTGVRGGSGRTLVERESRNRSIDCSGGRGWMASLFSSFHVERDMK